MYHRWSATKMKSHIVSMNKSTMVGQTVGRPETLATTLKKKILLGRVAKWEELWEHQKEMYAPITPPVLPLLII
jgi:hypothetical protein